MNKQLSLFEIEFLSNLLRYRYSRIYRSYSGHLYCTAEGFSEELIFDHLFHQLESGYRINIQDLLDGNINNQEKLYI